jgi:hypothetical protein
MFLGGGGGGAHLQHFGGEKSSTTKLSTCRKPLNRYSGLHPKQGYCSPGTKKTYVECTKYVHRHSPAKASSRQPQTTNKRTMAKASGCWYHDISFITWPNHMFETRKSIRSICSGHPLNLFCIGGWQLQFSVESCLLLAQR